MRRGEMRREERLAWPKERRKEEMEGPTWPKEEMQGPWWPKGNEKGRDGGANMAKGGAERGIVAKGKEKGRDGGQRRS